MNGISFEYLGPFDLPFEEDADEEEGLSLFNEAKARVNLEYVMNDDMKSVATYDRI